MDFSQGWLASRIIEMCDIRHNANHYAPISLVLSVGNLLSIFYIYIYIYIKTVVATKKAENHQLKRYCTHQLPPQFIFFVLFWLGFLWTSNFRHDFRPWQDWKWPALGPPNALVDVSGTVTSVQLRQGAEPPEVEEKGGLRGGVALNGHRVHEILVVENGIF